MKDFMKKAFFFIKSNGQNIQNQIKDIPSKKKLRLIFFQPRKSMCNAEAYLLSILI